MFEGILAVFEALLAFGVNITIQIRLLGMEDLRSFARSMGI